MTIALPCSYVLSYPQHGSLVTCGRPVYVYGACNGLCDSHNPTESYVYVVRRGSHVKIGTTVRPQQRIRSIMNGDGCVIPGELAGAPALLALVQGDGKTERLFHDAFAEYRDRGEWFRIEGRLAEWIKPMDPASYDMVLKAIEDQLVPDDEDEMLPSFPLPVDF